MHDELVPRILPPLLFPFPPLIMPKGKKSSEPKAEKPKADTPKKEAKMQSFTASLGRQANANGKLKDREIFELEFPDAPAVTVKEDGKDVSYPTLVGYGVMVRDQLYTRQTELTVATHTEHVAEAKAKMLDSLKEFLKTLPA